MNSSGGVTSAMKLGALVGICIREVAEGNNCLFQPAAMAMKEL
ncbi:hypothetical protein [Ruegeria sp. HKCCSP351]|nr:hypothetical protein [Ruegeria sp. HKCCSP351]